MFAKPRGWESSLNNEVGQSGQRAAVIGISLRLIHIVTVLSVCMAYTNLGEDKLSNLLTEPKRWARCSSHYKIHFEQKPLGTIPPGLQPVHCTELLFALITKRG